MYLSWALSGKPGEDYLMANVDANDPAIATVASPIGTYISYDFILTLITKITKVALAGESYDVDLTMLTGGQTLYRLREGIERFFITDINNPAGSSSAQSDLVLMMDLVSVNGTEFNHVPGGSNVLFMDGHTEFMKFPGEFPVTRVFAALTNLF